ncbi:MAG: acetyl-CoA synthase subunit gamma [Deltaproteobacteria bacterium]|nr:acetyl-CoA synthase subunit gamma [Deltaproteobacteria bacterium]
MRYLTAPGLYAIGEPDGNSDVFVSANYKLSFDILRRALKGFNAWILVLDTKGINVWCAAGKGTFGTDELIKRIFEARLYEVVEHKRIIVPQLGAPGIAAHVVQKETGFRVHYGPVEASDVRAYVNAGYKATEDMRLKRFPVADRLVLIPLELIPAMKHYAVYALIIFIVSGISPSGISFMDAWNRGLPFLFLGLAAIFAGAVVTPLALPLLPFRSFAVKGWLAGMALTIAALMGGAAAQTGKLFIVLSLIFYPLASSYAALQFTGASTYTGMTGVRKEMNYAMPVYIAGAVISAMLFAAVKLAELGLNPLRGLGPLRW